MTTQRKPKTSKQRAPSRKPAAPARSGSKQAQIIALMQRPAGATLAEMEKATGWQPHTVRGAIAGAIKKKLGLDVASVKEDRGRVYRIPASPR